jgi:hypothetical protein
MLHAAVSAIARPPRADFASAIGRCAISTCGTAVSAAKALNQEAGASA